jgi:hypothetical protein
MASKVCASPFEIQVTSSQSSNTLKFPDIDLKQFLNRYPNAEIPFDQFVQQLNKDNCHAVSQIPEGFWKLNEQVICKILKPFPEAWLYVPEKAKQDVEVMALAFPFIQEYLDVALKEDQAFAKALFQAALLWNPPFPPFYQMKENVEKVFQFITDRDKEFLQQVLVDGLDHADALFAGFPENLMEDKAFILESLTKVKKNHPNEINSGRLCRSLSHALNKDEPFLLAAIAIDPNVYFFLPEQQQNNLAFAAKACQANREVAKHFPVYLMTKLGIKTWKPLLDTRRWLALG